VQTTLTVVTQLADYHAGARFPATGWRLGSATRIARCQTCVASLTRLSCKIGYLLTSIQSISQPLPNSSRTTNQLRQVPHMRSPSPSPDYDRTDVMPQTARFPWSRVRKAVRNRQEARRLPPARREQRSCRPFVPLIMGTSISTWSPGASRHQAEVTIHDQTIYQLGEVIDIFICPTRGWI
jgi:hypothetical protein